MKQRTHFVIQAVLLVCQAANQALPMVPERYKPLVAISAGLVQGLVALYCHEYNTDGTRQETAFRKEEGR